MRLAYALLLLTSVANAEEPVPADAWEPRLSAGVGIGYRAGDLAILETTGGTAGGQVEVKVRPALFIDATYDHARGTARDEMRARDLGITTHAIGLAVRNPLMSFGDKPRELGGEMFVTAGLAREWVRWDGGGLARNALMVGLGSTLIAPHERVHRQVRVGLRVLFARAPDPGKRPAGCDGPCDTPTKTAPYDVSLVMEVSCHVGR